MFFTTSWDDGYALDLRVAEILSTHGLTGTFYLSPQSQHRQTMLSADQIRTLGRTMEIGAHTLHHPKLTQIPVEEARQEIAGSKAWVEDTLGKACTMFCYPKGDTNAEVQHLVRNSGYRGARTVDVLRFDVTDAFAMPTTLQIAPFPVRIHYRTLKHFLDPLGPLRVLRSGLDRLAVPWSARGSWLALATALFEKAIHEKLPVFHLWGHSAEVERYGMWEDLHAFCTYVSAAGVESMTNGQVLDRLNVV